ncbi:MAG: IclR family transcriptional regulator [Nocardioidaceae bacterium]
MSERPNPAGSLDRALAILEHLATAHQATVAELAKATGTSRSTTYRLVDRLGERGYLDRAHGDGQWRLGPSVARMAMAAVQSTDVIHAAPEVMRLLVQQTRETVGLGVFSHGEMVFVFRERGPQAVTVNAEPGARRPLYCTSVGKAFLAALPVAEGETLLRSLRLKAYTPQTLTSRQAVSRQLHEIRERGWAEDYQEYEPASICCGAAIRDHTGRPVGAISVSGLAERMRSQLPRFGPVVASTADAVSHKLGYAPEL